MAFFVYLLECSDNSYYCGYTKDLDRRIALHNKGKASRYTRARLPARLVYFEKKKTRAQAMRREAEIKGMSRKGKGLLISKEGSR